MKKIFQVNVIIEDEEYYVGCALDRATVNRILDSCEIVYKGLETILHEVDVAENATDADYVFDASTEAISEAMNDAFDLEDGVEDSEPVKIEATSVNHTVKIDQGLFDSALSNLGKTG